MAWTILGNVGYLATQWGIVTLLARHAGPDSVGRYALALAIIAPVMMLAGMQLWTFQATDTIDAYPFSLYLGLRYLSILFALSVLAIACLSPLLDWHSAALVVAIGLGKALDILNLNFYGKLQRHELMRLVSLSRLVVGVLSLALFALGLFVWDSLLVGASLASVASLVVLLTFNLHWVSTVSIGQGTAGSGSRKAAIALLKPTFNLAPLRSLFTAVLPLGVAASLISLEVSIPRFIVQHSLGASELGIYSALAYTTLAGSTLADAIGSAVSPRLASMNANLDFSGFRNLLVQIVALGAVGTMISTVLVWTFGEYALAILYTEEFAKRASLLILLAIATGIQFMGTILTFGMIAARVHRVQAILQLIVLLSLALCGPLFASRWGLAGVGITLIGIATLKLAGVALVLSRYVVDGISAAKLDSEARHA